MNVLGHPYVAYKVLGKLPPYNSCLQKGLRPLLADASYTELRYPRVFGDNLDEWVVAGSWLPDLVPFVPDSVFEFEEIHEGGERFLEYLDQHAPEKRGLALGMLTHSVKFGADGFSRSIEEQCESVRDELSQKIAESAGVSLEVARKHRFHNYLWWGIDVQILRHEKDFMRGLSRAVSEIDIREISSSLADCFDKNEPDVRRMLKWIFGPITQRNLSTVSGLARIWKETAADLPEKDQVNVEKTVEVFGYCADLLEESWRDILDGVIREVGKNVERFK